MKYLSLANNISVSDDFVPQHFDSIFVVNCVCNTFLSFLQSASTGSHAHTQTHTLCFPATTQLSVSFFFRTLRENVHLGKFVCPYCCCLWREKRIRCAFFPRVLHSFICNLSTSCSPVLRQSLLRGFLCRSCADIVTFYTLILSSLRWESVSPVCQTRICKSN